MLKNAADENRSGARARRDAGLILQRVLIAAVS